MRRCQELPGQELFQYLDEDRRAAPHRFGRRERLSARDHRRGHHRQGFPHLGRDHLAALELVPLREASQEDVRGGRRKRVAKQLGNTPAICRKSYIHPRVLTSYLDGSLKPMLATIAASVRAPEIYVVEGVVMRLLAEWTAADKLIAATLASRQQARARAS